MLAVLATGPDRWDRLQPVAAEGGEIHGEINAAEKPLGHAVCAPVEHCEGQAKNASGRKAGAATGLAFRASEQAFSAL
jgi:hypothetical protein